MIETGDKQAVELFVEFLAGWPQDHTTLTDRMMAAFVRGHKRTDAIGLSELTASPQIQRSDATAGVGNQPKDGGLYHEDHANIGIREILTNRSLTSS